MIYGLRKSFNDYEEIRVSDLATTYRSNSGRVAISEDGSTIALVESYALWSWEGAPGNLHLYSAYKVNRVNVKTGDDWTTNTLLDDSTGYLGNNFNIDANDPGRVAMSSDGSVIASVNTALTTDWSDDAPPVLIGVAGTLLIHHGASWGSVVRDHGHVHWDPDSSDYLNTTGWGDLVAVSGDGSVVVVSEPEHEDLVAGIFVKTGRLHVYSGTNWSTKTVLSNPVNNGGAPPVGYENTYMGSTALSVSSDGSKIIASLGTVREIEQTWAGTPGASDYDAAEYWTSRAIIFSGSGWSTSTVLVADRVLMKTDHYHYSGGSFSRVSTAWSRWWGPVSGGLSYSVPTMPDLDWSDDGSIVFWSDPSYQDDKGAVHVYSGANWATHTIVTLTGSRSKQYSGTQYTSTPSFYGSMFGGQVRSSGDGAKFFAKQGTSFYEFVKPSTTWNEAGGTVLANASGHQPEIARGSYPIMLSPAVSTNEWGTSWYRVDLLSYGLGAASIIKRTQSQSRTANAVKKKLAQPGSFTISSQTSPPYFKSMSVIKRSMAGSGGINAVVMPVFRVGAIRRQPVGKSVAADAYIVDARRSRHSRSTPPHYDNDVDTVIALGKAIGVYSVGDDLHTVLTAIVNRIIDLEGKSRTLSPEFTAGSIFMRSKVIDDVIRLAAALIVRTVESLTASSILLRESNEGSALVDAWVYGIFATETSFIDAVLQIARDGSLSADALLLAERQFGVLVEAHIGGLTIERSLSADAILSRVSTASTTADATKHLAAESYGSMVRALNPLVWYRFSEADGPFIDIGSSAGNATLTGSPGRNAGGAVDDDSGASFSGSEYATTAVYTLAIGNVFTIEAWIYPTSTGRRTIWSGGNSSSQFQLEIGGNGTDRLSAIVNGTFVAETNNGVITRNAWSHVVYRRSGTGASTHRFWVNGVEQSLLVNSSVNYINSSVVKHVGARVAGSQQFTGTIDEIAIFGSALDPVEIVRHYMAGSRRMGLSSRSVIKRLDQAGTKTIDANFLPVQPLTRLDAIKLRPYSFNVTASSIIKKVTEQNATIDAQFFNGTRVEQALTADYFVQPYFRANAYIVPTVTTLMLRSYDGTVKETNVRPEHTQRKLLNYERSR